MSSREINISSSKHSKKHCREGKRKRDRRHKREERMLLEKEANQSPKEKIVTLNCGSENLNETFHSPSSGMNIIVEHKGNKNEENTEEVQEHTDEDQDQEDEQEKDNQEESGQFEEWSGKQTEEGFEELSGKQLKEFGEQSGEQSGVDDNESSCSTKFPKASINYTLSEEGEYYVEFVGKYENTAKTEFYCHGRLTQSHCKEARAEASIQTEESFQKKKHYETGNKVKERLCTPANLNKRAPSIFPVYVHLFVLIFHLILIAWHLWCLFLNH